MNQKVRTLNFFEHGLLGNGLFYILLTSICLRLYMFSWLFFQSCRVNLKQNATVCDAMIDKAKFNINCANELYYNSENETRSQFVEAVCLAEIKSQQLGTSIRGYISPFESLFGIIIILIAGTWSDKQSRRKPCIIAPLCGEFLSYASLLTGAIFINELPMEFSTILGTLLPAVFGDFTLLFMGIYSYLTEITTEEDRMFRFGVIAQMLPIVSMVALPFSGTIYQVLGYTNVFLLGMAINSLGLLYGIFVLKENNIGFAQNQEDNEIESMEPLQRDERRNTELIKSIINTYVLKDCWTVVTKKRNGSGRSIIVLLLILTMFVTGPSLGEMLNEYFFVRAKLNWEALEESPFAAYGSVMTFLGTTIMITGMGQIYKLSDTMLGIISSVFSTVARLVYIGVSTNLMMYIGETLDLFSGVSPVITKSIAATIIENNETARMYSLLGVVENLGRLIFVPIYSFIYRQSVLIFPNSYFICSLISFGLATGIFITIHFLIKRDIVSSNINPEIQLKVMDVTSGTNTKHRRN